MNATVIDAASLVAVAGVFGAMVFFALVYAPLVLIRNDEADGGPGTGRHAREAAAQPCTVTESTLSCSE